MASRNRLVSDQLLKLNTLLWALQRLPEGGPVEPVLRGAGYRLAAMGRPVAIPEDRTVLRALVRLNGYENRSPYRTDLWIEHSSDRVQLIVELQALSSPPDASAGRQARKLLVSAFDLSTAMAGTHERRGHVVYAAEASHSARTAATLRELSSELLAESAPAAPAAVLGFAEDGEGVHIMSPAPGDLPDPAARRLSSPATVLHREGRNDPRPLYLVPWLPGSENSQDPQLRADGLSDLTARLLVHALAEVGRAQPPTSLALDCPRILSRATFGMFDYWHGGEKKKFSQTAIRVLTRAMRGACAVRRTAGDVLVLDLSSAADRDAVINRLRRADPADSASNLQAIGQYQPSLF